MIRRPRLFLSDLIFRMGTGAFALVLVLIVSGIGIVLWQESHLAIQKFGFAFWRTSQWNPVNGEFGAFPFIWGTLYSSILALAIAGPIAIGIAIFLSELCPPWLRTPLVFLTELLAAIPSIVYGLWGVFVLIPNRPVAPDFAAGLDSRHPRLQRPACGRQPAVGRVAARDHGDSVLIRGRARSAEIRPRVAA
jgi:ABC-type phosphate transport system permease subunit